MKLVDTLALGASSRNRVRVRVPYYPPFNLDSFIEGVFINLSAPFLFNLIFKNMCWFREELIPIVLKKPLKVYKIGTIVAGTIFETPYRHFKYMEGFNYPTLELIPDLKSDRKGTYYFRIFKGYHAYTSLYRAKKEFHNTILTCTTVGLFEIPKGATVYINFREEIVVSSNIKYLSKII